MGKVMAGMTVSLDGFMDADKVSPDFDELLQAPSFKEKTKNTGAVIMGRHVYDMADHLCGLMMIMNIRFHFSF